MIKPTKFIVTLEKSSLKRLEPFRLRNQLDHMKARAINATRLARGWKAKIISENLDSPKKSKGTYSYTTKMSIVCRPGRTRAPEKIDLEFFQIRTNLEAAAKTNQWLLSLPTDDKSKKPTEQRYAEASIPEDWKKHFNHLYERDDQVGLVLSSIQAGITSDWQDRFHVLLVGDPASGKTEILRGVRSLLGDDAVLEYDATATTQAGAIKDLSERSEIPRVLLIEEIEKVDENSLRWLLGVLDHRGEIRKTTFRQQIHKQARMLCVATVNDYRLFRKMMYGALASRFPNHVWCPRPDRAVLKMILEREVKRLNGRKAWIEPTLNYAMKRSITDPRRVISICLCGANDLLTGEYQKKLDRTDALTNFRKFSRKRKKPVVPIQFRKEGKNGKQ